MKAYNMAMGYIFICCGFAVVFSLDLFGSQFQSHASIWNTLSGIANFTIPGTEFPTVIALAGLIAIASSFIGSKVISSSGVAIQFFTGIFWTSYTLAFVVLSQLPVPGIDIFLTIFTVVGVLIFTISVIQMPTGGQKSFV